MLILISCLFIHWSAYSFPVCSYIGPSLCDYNIIFSRFPTRLTDYLGSGEFGRVEQGTMKTSSGAVIDVAVKTLPEDATQIDKVRFLQEAVIMAQFKHPNVVNMYGVVKDKALVRQ